ncbi:hypothetical protein RJ44_14815 [Alteromonas macleodii]|uniref:hypothetical protein n=1 Tax=Alteromonas macleodii TaxID=28108 RepID=UPI00057F13BA|nr:hypothetical protein [Alteromonas macleodii]KHT57703.1 hypothetical protein RJ44_14815 [Alteromonas macleodii]
MPNLNDYLFPVNEVKCLLKQAADSAIPITESISKPLYDYIEAASESNNVPENINTSADWPAPEEVGRAYTELCKLTKPVTGKTIVDSQTYKRFGHGKTIIITCVIFLLLALTNLIFELQLANYPPPTDGEQNYIEVLQTYFLIPLAPFFWGGLGSCIFLIKKFSDLAADRTFNYDYYGGWKSRVLLGTVLGGIIPYLFNIELKDGSVIDDYTVAFLVGLSVKIVYGALEKIVNELATKMSLGSAKEDSIVSRIFTKDEIKKLKEVANRDF